MATRAERQEHLEQKDRHYFEELAHRLGDVGLEKSRDKMIELLLNAADLPGAGDEYDRAFGLATNTEQQLVLQHKSINAAQMSARASIVSAACALLAITVAVVALWVAWHAGE